MLGWGDYEGVGGCSVLGGEFEVCAYWSVTHGDFAVRRRQSTKRREVGLRER
jgi:hypothetical protein